MLVEMESQRRTITNMQRMDCHTIVNENNYALKREAGYFHDDDNDDDDDDDDVLCKFSPCCQYQNVLIYIHSFIHSSVFSLRGRVGRNQSPAM